MLGSSFSHPSGCIFSLHQDRSPWPTHVHAHLHTHTRAHIHTRTHAHRAASLTCVKCRDHLLISQGSSPHSRFAPSFRVSIWADETSPRDAYGLIAYSPLLPARAASPTSIFQDLAEEGRAAVSPFPFTQQTQFAVPGLGVGSSNSRRQPGPSGSPRVCRHEQTNRNTHQRATDVGRNHATEKRRKDVSTRPVVMLT